jgi:SAM-dependent methyltransferase
VANNGGVSNETFSSSMEGARNYNRWVVSAFEPFFGRSLLEIGMGHGGFYDHLPPLDAYVGLDIDDELVAHARARYPDRRFVQADVADPGLPDRLDGTRFDTVLCVNVLEHVQDDRAAVASLLRLIEPGGHLLIFVPAFRQLYTDLDRLAGHLRRYTKAEVAALADVSGAEIRRLEYFNPVGALGWWANGMKRHNSLESRAVTGQVAFFDTYVLPVSKMLNSVTRPEFGQSVVCAVRKVRPR